MTGEYDKILKDIQEGKMEKETKGYPSQADPEGDAPGTTSAGHIIKWLIIIVVIGCIVFLIIPAYQYCSR